MTEMYDRQFLVAVLEKDETTRGKLLFELQREGVVAVGISGISEIRTVYEHIRPRVLVLDVDQPDEEELALVRTVRATDTSGCVSVILLGNVPEQTISLEMCELVDIYVPKPADWHAVAQTVIRLATDRRPPSTGQYALRHA